MQLERRYLTIAALAIAGLGMTGCGATQSAAQSAPPQGQPGQYADLGPADGNLAPVDSQGGAPQQGNYAPQQVSSPNYNQQDDNQNYDADADYADDGSAPIYATQAPPPLPEYSQPPAPGDNYMWTPGYWSYANTDYYWVPGAWVLAPYVDALWTPPYWDFYSGRYRWHRGYWGQYVGFYGGINYGFGYTGRGYYGGYWSGGRFAYNRAVTNVNINIVHNVYDRRVANNTVNRVSFNGGPGGITARPIPAEIAARRETRTPPVAAQIDHARSAAANRAQFASANRGRPALAAQAQPLATSYRTPAARPQQFERAQPAAAQNSPRPGAPAFNQNRPAQNGGPVQQPLVTGRGAGRQDEVRPGLQRPQVQRPEAQRQEVQRPQEAQRPQFRPEPNRAVVPSAPAPQARPVVPEARPQGQVGRQERPNQVERERGAPGGRPEVARPAQEAPRAAPRMESRPGPGPAAAPRPAPQAHPGPQGGQGGHNEQKRP